MRILSSDLTGWTDETGRAVSHHLTSDAAIASIAIIVLMVLIVQLMTGGKRRGDSFEADQQDIE